MKKMFGIPCLVLFLTGLFPVLAQVTIDQPRVLVLPVENRTARAQNDAVARAVTDSMVLTLRLLDAYELVSPDGQVSGEALDQVPEVLDELAERRGADALIFGSVETDAAGAMVFTVYVYDRAVGEITVEARSRAESIFDVFDASDDLVTDAISGFSGMRIGFGTLRIRPVGSGDYAVYIDGSEAGTNVTVVDHVLIGERTVEIRRRRADLESLLHRETVQVQPGETRTLTFSVPVITSEELQREETRRTRIITRLDAGVDPDGTAGMITDLAILYEALPEGFPGAAREIQFYRDRVLLAREMQDLVLLDLRPYAERAVAPGGAGIADLKSRRDPWNEVYLHYREEEQHWLDLHVAGVPPDDARSWYQFTPRQRRERVQEDLRRNLSVLAALITLERAAVTDRGEADLVVGYNNLLNAVQSLIEVPVRAETTWSVETQRAREAMRSYRRAEERTRPAWHWIAGGVGAGALGYAAYVQYSGTLGDREDRIEELIPLYEASTDFDEIVSLRSEIRDEERELLALEVTRDVAIGVGATLVATALVGRVVSATRPARIWRGYRNDAFLERWTAAAIEYRVASPRDTGPPSLLVLGAEESFTVNGVADAWTTPQMVMVDAAPDDVGRGRSSVDRAGDETDGSWRIQPLTTGFTRVPEFEVPYREGTQILYLGVRR